MSWEDIHPAINALLNGSSAVLLVVGFRAIHRGHRDRHRRLMIGAFSISTIFLLSYLARFAISGTHRYPGVGWDRVLYLGVLASHSLLAATLLFLVPRTIWLAIKGREHEHRRLARITWPIWIYVSVTGVIVYLMLYPIAAAIYGA